MSNIEHSTDIERARTDAEVRALLAMHNINTRAWGDGATKTVDQLVTEVIKGESRLIEDPETGSLRREAQVLRVDVLYRTAEGEYLYLVEDRQVFADGAVRRRNIQTSLGEKLTADESPDESVERGLQEELGVERLDAIYDLGVKTKTQESPSYPGLQTEMVFHDRAVTLAAEDFRPAGYCEQQPDKSTFFRWMRVIGTDEGTPSGFLLEPYEPASDADRAPS